MDLFAEQHNQFDALIKQNPWHAKNAFIIIIIKIHTRGVLFPICCLWKSLHHFPWEVSNNQWHAGR